MRLLVALTVAAALISCGDGDFNADGVSDCGHEPALSYDNWGKGFMSQYCAGCHSSTIAPEQRMGAPAWINLDTYVQVLTHVDGIEAQALLPEPNMPPSGGPFEWELHNLAEWIECTVRDDAERWQEELE